MNKSNSVRFRYTDDGIVVSKPNKFKLEFPKGLVARKVKDGVEVFQGPNGRTKIFVDTWGIKHYH